MPPKKTSRQRILAKAEEYFITIEELTYNQTDREWRLECFQFGQCEIFYGAIDGIIGDMEYTYDTPMVCECCGWTGSGDDLGSTGHSQGNLPVCPSCGAVDCVEERR